MLLDDGAGGPEWCIWPQCCLGLSPAVRRRLFQLHDTYVLPPMCLFVSFALLEALRADGVLSVPRAAAFAPLIVLFAGALCFSLRVAWNDEGDDRTAFLLIGVAALVLLISVALVGFSATSYIKALSPVITLLGLPNAVFVGVTVHGLVRGEQAEAFRTLFAMLGTSGNGLLAVVLICLKLDGTIAWGWRYVLVPFWIIDIVVTIADTQMVCSPIAGVGAQHHWVVTAIMGCHSM